MSDAWDPSLYDPTTRPADGLLLKAIGGRSGTIALENGQKLRFPFKAQQQVSGSAPPRIQSYEVNTGGQHTLHLQVAGAVMDANAPKVELVAPFPDETDEPWMTMASGGYPSSDQASITLRGHATLGTIEFSGAMTGYDSLAIDDITNRIGAMTIDSSSTLTLRSGNTMTLQPDANVNAQVVTTGTGDILLDSADGLTIDGSTLVSILGGDIDLTSGDDITITAGDLLTLGAGGNVNIDPTGTVLIQTTGGNISMGTGSSSITIGNATSTVNLHGVDINNQWTAYTPLLNQSVSVSKTVQYARYQRIGRTIIVEVYLNAVTSAGTSGQPILVQLPVTAAQASIANGTFWWYDASAGQNYAGLAYLYSTTYVGGLPAGTANNIMGAWGGLPTQIDSGDAVIMSIVYEAAT